MFGSVVLDVAIGLIFVYLLISLMVTAVTEIVAALLKSRAKNLWKGVRNILDSGTARTWVDQLYSHPLIESLSSPGKEQATGAGDAATKKPRYGPSYIPSRTFALSLLEIVREPRRALEQQIDEIPDTAPLADLKAKLTAWADPKGWKDQAKGWIDAIPDNLSTAEAKAALRKVAGASLPEILGSIPDAKLRGSLLALYDDAKGDVDELKKNIEVWFNNSMDRVSGWYKRNTQYINFGIAAVVVLFLNIDTVLLVRALSENETLRKAIVAEAEAYAETTDRAAPPAADGTGTAPVSPDEQLRRLRDQIGALGLPIGWRSAPPQNPDFRQFPGLSASLWGQTIGFHLLGWLVSMFAVSLGAPFWFDMLNKVISIRSSGRAPEEKPKSPEKVPQPREPGNVPATSDAQRVVVEFRGTTPG
jgi:hypothetical protein